MRCAALFLLSLLAGTLSFAQNDFNALTDKGYEQLSGGNAVEARQTLEEALRVLPKSLEIERKADFFNNLGVAYYQTGEYKKGLDAYEYSLGFYEKLKNDSLVAGALLNLGLAYKEIGAFRQAVLAITRAARLSEKYGNQRELSAEWNAIGNIQRETGNFVKALDYHLRALHIRESIGYDKGTADSYHNIGTLYLEWAHYDQAETYLLEALRRKKMLNNQSNTVNTLSALGRLYVAKKESRKALFYLNMAYKMRKAAGNSPKAASSLYYLGTYYQSIGERVKALELFRQAQDLARSSNDHSLLSNALMSEISLLEASRSEDPLLKKYEELVKTQEQQAEDESRKEMTRLEIEYDVERKEREIEMRRKQAKLDKIRIENQALRNQRLIGWIIGLSLLAITVSVLFYQIRKRKRQIELQNQELAEQTEEITHLHLELSHRTKNYFSLLSGILKSDQSQVVHPEATKVLKDNIRRLEAMSLVQHYLLDDSSRRNKEVRLDAYFSRLIELIVLNLFPGGSNLVLKQEIDPIYMDYDVAMRLAIALNELMCNAIEHGLSRTDTPGLNISVKQSGNNIELTVKDNGPGMDENQLEAKTRNGQQLITKLLYKIDGSIEYYNEKGCVAVVKITV